MSNDYVVECEYLYNNRDNHDKVYNLAIRTKGKSYEVVIEYGARTSVLKQLVKYSGPSLVGAREVYNKLISEKTGKGYRVVNSDRSGRSTIFMVPVSNQNMTEAQIKEAAKKAEAEAKKKENDKYNPNAIPERRLDFDDL